tara:strand:- start:133 stop:354 length:222 start_codon:yes stop_codon:yes gene_type:complete
MLNLGMDTLEGKFVIKDQGKLLEFDRCGDLPDEFDHLISFEPKIPDPPHSVAEHVEMSKWSEYLQELCSRQRK